MLRHQFTSIGVTVSSPSSSHTLGRFFGILLPKLRLEDFFPCLLFRNTWKRSACKQTWRKTYSFAFLPQCRVCLCPHRASPHSSPGDHWDHSCTPRSTQLDRCEWAPECELPAAPETQRPRPVYSLTTHTHWHTVTATLQLLGSNTVWMLWIIPGAQMYGWQLSSSRQPFLLTWHKWLLGQGLGLHGWMTSSTTLLSSELGAGGFAKG